MLQFTAQKINQANRLPTRMHQWSEQPSLATVTNRTIANMQQAKNSVDLVSEDDLGTSTLSQVLRRSSRNSNRIYRDQHNMFLTPEDHEKYLIWKGFTVYRGDLRRLEPEVYLNDTLIDLANSYYHQEVVAAEKREKIYVFSCQFLSKYMLEKDERVGYQSVRRWTLSVDLFEHDYIFIPINHAHHWSLLCIVKPRLIIEQAQRTWPAQTTAAATAGSSSAEGKVSAEAEEERMVEISDTEDEKRQDKHDERPCILFMDSLGMHRSNRFGRAVQG
jgi:Ulp1 family protease